MKKENFVTLVMSTIGELIFALGMCMALLPEWNTFKQGIVCGAVGAGVLNCNGNHLQKDDRSITNPVKRKNNRYCGI